MIERTAYLILSPLASWREVFFSPASWREVLRLFWECSMQRGHDRTIAYLYPFFPWRLGVLA
jgi:hypothetical protein